MDSKTTTKPAPVEDCYGDNRWNSIHARFLVEAKEKEPDVILIGDYLVSQAAHTEIWEKYFISMHCLNFGIADDRTQNVLWRIENGELSNCCPKIVVLSVGANNYADSVDDIVDGIVSCARAIASHQPSSKIIVLKILPCGQNPNPLREKYLQVNIRLDEILSTMSNIQIMNLDPGFVNSDRTISHHDLYDYAHLTRGAYSRAFEPLADALQDLLGGDHSEPSLAQALE